MNYIRQRNNGSWQFRIYNDQYSCSYTNNDLDAVIEYRNDFLGYDPDTQEASNASCSEPNILLIDIEIAPMKVYTWSLWDKYTGINQIIEDSYLLCFAYKWLHESEVHVKSLTDFDEYWLTNSLWTLLENADIVITHNGDRFDLKHINTFFLKHGFNKPTPFKTVDTLKIAKRNFKFASNKLDYIVRTLTDNSKLKHEGFELWIGCMNGDPNSWEKMKSYNIQDVLILEDIYLKLRGWDNHPNLNHYYSDNIDRCTTCGETKLEVVKPVYTAVSAFTAYRCNNCGQIMRTTKRFTRQELVNAR